MNTSNNKSNIWINTSTGETIEIDSILLKEESKQLWFKAYLKDIICLLGLAFGNQQLRILEYIVNNVDSNNLIIASYQEISDKSKIPIATVKRTIKALKTTTYNNNTLLAQPKRGILMLNPILAYKGDEFKQRKLLITWKNASTNK